MERVHAVEIAEFFSPATTFPTFATLINVFVRNALVLAGLILFILLVFGGFSVIMGAGGDTKKLEQGKQALTGAAIGLILIVSSIWIVQIIGVVTGANVNILTP